MSKDLLHIKQGQAHWNTSGTRIIKYSVEMYHDGLKEHKLITAPEEDILRNKAEIQVRKWEEKWKEIESRRINTEQKEANIEEANRRTKESQEVLKAIQNILVHTLSIDDTVNWELLKKTDEFNVPKPTPPRKDAYKKIPSKPDKDFFLIVLLSLYWIKYLNPEKRKKLKIVRKNIAGQFLIGKIRKSIPKNKTRRLMIYILKN